MIKGKKVVINDKYYVSEKIKARFLKLQVSRIVYAEP